MSEGKPIWLHLDSIGVSAPTSFRSFVGVLPPLQASDSRAFSEGWLVIRGIIRSAVEDAEIGQI